MQILQRRRAVHLGQRIAFDKAGDDANALGAFALILNIQFAAHQPAALSKGMEQLRFETQPALLHVGLERDHVGREIGAAGHVNDGKAIAGATA